MTIPQRIFDLPRFQEKNTPGITIFNYKENKEWKGISTADFIKRVNNISKGLLAHDVQPNDKVALISENRLEWNLLDFAIQQIGAVVVAIYPNMVSTTHSFSIKISFDKRDFQIYPNMYAKISINLDKKDE